MRGSNIDYRFIYYNINALNLINLVFNNNIKYIKNEEIKIIKLILFKFKVFSVVNHVFLVSRDNINSFNTLS